MLPNMAAGSTLINPMPKFEKPQKGNPHQLAISQHVFPAKSIARFAGADGKVQLHMQRPSLVRRAKPTDSIFCAQRVWDHGSEVGFIKALEDRFQRLASLIIDGRIVSFDQEQTHTISAFYVLWMARAQLREQPAQKFDLQGILPGRERSRDEEEQLEKAGLAFHRGTTVPSHVVNGLHVRLLVSRYLRQMNPTATWGIVRASSGEFVVPDWPVYSFVPVNPTVVLANPAINQTLERDTVRLVNAQLRSASRRYFFARDFAECR